MVTFVPSGLRRMSEAWPICTPDISTAERGFKPPTFFAARYKSYVGRNSEVPLLNCTSKTVRTANPIKTNRPTLHSRRFFSILKLNLLQVRDPVDEAAHDRVLRIENFVGRPRHVNFFVIQHQDALAHAPRTTHIVSHDHASHFEPVAHSQNQLVDGVGNNRIQSRR